MSIQGDPKHKQARRRVAAEIGRIRREMEDMADEAQTGHSLGQLLRRRVELQHRIQQLRDEEERLRRESFINMLMERRRSDKERRSRSPLHHSVKRETPSPTIPEEEESKDVGSAAEVVEAVVDKRCESPPVAEVHMKPARVSVCAADTSESESTPERKSESAKIESIVVTPPRPITKPTTVAESEVSKPEEASFIAAGLDKALLQMIQSSERRVTAVEAQAEAARRAKDAKLRETNLLREQSKRRFELVDDMYTKAIERRMRAMRRIAADPPADRLIGQNAAQHVPLSMLTKETRKLGMCLMPGAQKSQNAKGGTGVSGLLEMHRSNFFLTGVDASRSGVFIKGHPENSVEAEINEHLHGQSEETPSDGRGGRLLRPSGAEDLEREAHEELLRQWRELGYTAVYLPASRRLAFPFSEGREGTRRRRDPYAWMHLDPLPVVHLIQRRLPEQPLTRPVVGLPASARAGCPTVRGASKNVGQSKARVR